MIIYYYILICPEEFLMMYYTVSQWLIFFFIYCFFGWIWECCYVSVRKRKWVNRGFLHGPFLPIYGSGAIVILLSTIAVKDIVPLVFLLGMTASTILEFCTGCCMEKLFGVRYWDYSNLPLNFKGHICFFISLAWGGFSIILVCFIHKPIEALVIMIPKTIADIIALALSVYMAVDFTISINEAMDLRATLEKFTKENEQLKTYARRVEITATFAEEEFNKKKEQFMAMVNEERRMLAEKADRRYSHIDNIIKRNPDAVSVIHKDSINEIKEIISAKKYNKK